MLILFFFIFHFSSLSHFLSFYDFYHRFCLAHCDDLSWLWLRLFSFYPQEKFFCSFPYPSLGATFSSSLQLSSVVFDFLFDWRCLFLIMFFLSVSFSLFLLGILYFLVLFFSIMTNFHIFPLISKSLVFAFVIPNLNKWYRTSNLTIRYLFCVTVIHLTFSHGHLSFHDWNITLVRGFSSCYISV